MPYKDPEKQREYQKKWEEKNKEKRRESNKKWKKENPEYDKKWNAENKEKKREYDKKWREKNKDKIREKNKKWREENPEYDKKYYEKNKEQQIEASRKWNAENKEKKREYDKKWYEKNKEKKRECDKKWKKEKYHTDPCYKLRILTSNMAHKALKEGKGGKSMLPYVDWDSYEELKEHIESQFEDWMTWDNHGEWHIDHIKPQSVLLEGVTSMDDPKFRECWALENLRPLEARENISKGNKIIDE